MPSLKREDYSTKQAEDQKWAVLSETLRTRTEVQGVFLDKPRGQ
jgi:hypothetical protein